MSKINIPPISIDDFVRNHFLLHPKNVLFWDTCCLLDIVRLPYRNGDFNAIKSIIDIKRLVDNGDIYSLCSILTQTEWNEHENKIIHETQENLEKTSIYHKNSIDIINHISTSSFTSIKLHDKGLIVELEKIADEILANSKFLETGTISDNALMRVAQKKPPASKKREFKDCAIWETVLSVASLVQGAGYKMVYFTVNTDDYMDKSRNPNIPFSNINSEIVSYGIGFTLTFQDTFSKIV